MRIAIVDERASRASIIEDGLSSLPDCELYVLTQRDGLIARIAEIEPDIVFMDLGNPSRDVLEEYFTVSRALAHPIAMFVDESDDDSIAASFDAGVSTYVVDGLSAKRIQPLLRMLAERDTVDKAKRILMKTKGVTEPAAYAELRQKAMSSNRRIADIADAVVTAHELMGEA